MPHAVALLYSLYLYAEHTGRRSFTFSELISAKNNPDATGMSPSDIYGIDVKAFREQVQGLAMRSRALPPATCTMMSSRPKVSTAF